MGDRPAWVYLLECADGTLYTGWCYDLMARLAQHNAGRGAKYTRSRCPVTLRWSEPCIDRQAAMRREAAIKKLKRPEKLKLMTSEELASMPGVNWKNLREEHPEPTEGIAGHVREILIGLGEDPEREGLQRTPERVARMYAELTEGYHVDPVKLINDAIFEVDYDEMVIVQDIDYASLCEHHTLPFLGRAHVAYIPGGKVIGLSKIPRIVEMYAKRFQIQERMTNQIADFLMEHLDPRGVGVVVEGQHMCSMIRGVRQPNSLMVTSAMRGLFKKDPRTRAEFMALLDRRR
ncbi:MAG: GTP cyclohydrolase I FolE [Ardenticatenales bacterium]|nr:GTP cyclohydrolase I FolE [Ardenticatenales bacterium]